MRNWIKTGIALFAFMGITASASSAVPCTPIPPKDTSGSIGFLHPGQSLATTYFEQNACDWKGLDQLNGTDGTVLDATGQAGAGTFSATATDTTSLLVVIQGHFLDESCARIDGADFHSVITPADNALPTLITIPANAKWAVVDTSDANITNQINVGIHSNGTDCPKKKKKKH
jgi:hypothetical protein